MLSPRRACASLAAMAPAIGSIRTLFSAEAGKAAASVVPARIIVSSAFFIFFPLSLKCVAFENEGGVDAAKGEIVRHDVLALQRAAAARDVVERRAGRVDLLQIDRGCEPALAHH